MTLNELAIGKKAKIIGMSLEQDMARRLWDLGFIKGTVVEAVQSSPSGDPIAYRVRNTIFAIRNKDAQKIEIREEE